MQVQLVSPHSILVSDQRLRHEFLEMVRGGFVVRREAAAVVGGRMPPGLQALQDGDVLLGIRIDATGNACPRGFE